MLSIIPSMVPSIVPSVGAHADHVGMERNQQQIQPQPLPAYLTQRQLVPAGEDRGERDVGGPRREGFPSLAHGRPAFVVNRLS